MRHLLHLLLRAYGRRHGLLVLLRIVLLHVALLDHSVLVVSLLVLALNRHSVDLTCWTASLQRLDRVPCLHHRALRLVCLGRVVFLLLFFILVSNLVLVKTVKHTLIVVLEL